MYVEVILPLNLPNTLTYGVPIEYQEHIQIGIRVEVKLGKDKVYAGIIKRIHYDQPEGYRIHPILSIIDQQPILQSWQLDFWKWIHEYYMEPMGLIMQAALPAHLKLMNESFLVWDDKIDEIPEEFPITLQVLLHELQKKKKLSFTEVKAIVPAELIGTVIQDALNFELVTISDALEEKYQEKKKEVVQLHPKYHSEEALKELFLKLSNAPKQRDIVMVYLANKPQFKAIDLPVLLEKSRATKSIFNQLVVKEVFEVTIEKVNRWTFREEEVEAEVIELSTAQNKAYSAIKETFQVSKPALLHGWTGSGKTLIYIKLIQEVLSQGKQVLFLLPEIALTTQIVSRLTAYFKGIIGVYHSQYDNNERVELWNKVQSGACKLIVGARSSIWLPFHQLGMIIVDEEHEASFKQNEPSPRYQARDVALYLAHSFKIPILLGSATPSLEMMRLAQLGRINKIALKERYGKGTLPSIEVVSAKHINPALSDFLTVPLLKAIEEQLNLGKQVLLFQNKRGYVPIIICVGCQQIVQCKHCDVSMTYHKESDRLHCHYCGVKGARPKQCASCGSHRLISKSFGTEKVEEELQKIFKKHKIGRLDWDTAKTRNRQKKIIEQFERGSIDILVGTQMIVKGFDFPNVGLVGVLSADSLWSFPNFRAQERAFQLFIQVSGRAGRSEDQGKVIIQAFNTEHPVLKKVVAYQQEEFYEEEMRARSFFYYPPITRLIELTIKDRDEHKCVEGSKWLAYYLNEPQKLTVQGPAAAVVPRVRNQYLQEILIKSSPQQGVLQENKKIIEEAITKTKAQRGFSNLQVIVNVDPN